MSKIAGFLVNIDPFYEPVRIYTIRVGVSAGIVRLPLIFKNLTDSSNALALIKHFVINNRNGALCAPFRMFITKCLTHARTHRHKVGRRMQISEETVSHVSLHIFQSRTLLYIIIFYSIYRQTTKVLIRLCAFAVCCEHFKSTYVQKDF